MQALVHDGPGHRALNTVDDDRTPDHRLRRLAEILTCEYAGALAADRVLRAVSAAAHALHRLELSENVRWDLTEQTARRDLTHQLACL